MKKYIFSTLTICLSIGIIISDLSFSKTNLRIIFFVLIILLFLIVLIKLKHQVYVYIYLIIVVGLGFFIHQNKERGKIVPNNNIKKIYLLKVIYKQNTASKRTSYVVKDLENRNKIILNLKNEVHSYYPNDELIVYGEVKEIQPPLNPNQFNYKRFLKRKNIYYQLYADRVISIHEEGKGFTNWSSKSKLLIRKALKNKGYSLESRSIISSMLLGDRTELTKELNQNYISTGVVHILSISGLHVMMIYMILNFIFKPLLRIKNGRKVRIILNLSFIWLFSFYVELEPPVFRSALMITIYYVSELLNRPKNIYHTLSLSAFVILVFQPNYLFDVGFQLSYFAVFFIVWLNPIFEKMWRVNNILLKNIRSTISTSISAQLGTMPVSIFYFNQFSGLFLFGNLVLIPASFIMICGGIISIIMLLFDLNIPLYVWFYNQFVYWSNQYIGWLANIPFVAKDIYISISVSIFITIAIYTLNPIILQKSKKAFWVFIFCVVGIELDRSIRAFTLNHSSELIVFNQYRNSIVGVRNGRNLSVFSKQPIDEKTYNYLIKPYKVIRNVKNIEYYSYESSFKHKYFIKHENSIETKSFDFHLNQTKSNRPFYVLFHGSKVYQYDNDSNLVNVIADASNYPHVINQLRHEVSNTKFWATNEKGYFSIKF